MEILYRDNKIVVCVKPAGVLSTDEPGGMPEQLRAELGDAETKIYTVHRLDAAAGGVMVYARTRHAAADLSRYIREDRVEKTYRAVLRGVPAEKSGELRDFLFHDARRRMTFVVPGPGKDVKESALAYTVLQEREGLALTEIRLITGRTHQIRCQFAHRGMPLWGDGKYGLPGESGPLALWSRRLAFLHPVTGERMEFAKAPPAAEPWTLFDREEKE